MRGRIARPKRFAQTRTAILFFCEAFGVRARPRAAFAIGLVQRCLVPMINRSGKCRKCWHRRNTLI